MSTPPITTRVALDGEKEYKQAVSNINSALKTLDSELTLAKAKFADNAQGMDALAERNDILNRKLLTQQEKVEELRKAHENAARVFGESDERTMRWQQSLNKAQAEEINLQREIAATAAALEKSSGALDQNADSSGKASESAGKFREAMEAVLPEAQGLGDAVGGLADKLGVKLPDGATKALNGLQTLGTGATVALGALGLLIAAIVKITDALYDMTINAAAGADELLTLATQTGLTTRELQEFQYASELLDVSVDTLQGSLTKLVRSMDDARAGKNVAAAFEELGVSVTNADGSLRDAKKVFDDCIDALGEVENATERDALAMEIFGRSAQDLNPLIEAGSGALRELGEEAERVGYVLGESALAKLGAVDDAVQRLHLTTETFHKQMSVQFAPYAEKALTRITEFIDKMGNALVESGAADAFGSILDSVTSLLDPLGEIIKGLLPLLKPLLAETAVTLAAISDILNVIVGLLSLDLNTVAKGLSFTNLQNTISNLNKMTGNTGYSTKSITGSSYGSGGSESRTQVNGSTSNGVDYYTDRNGNVWIPTSQSRVSYIDKEEMYDAWAEKQLANGNFAASYELWEQRYYHGPSFDAGGHGGSFNAAGNFNWPGGLTWVGENGPELAWLPSGTRISTAQESREMSGGDTYITVNVAKIDDLQHLLEIVENAKRLGRMRA